MSTESAMSARFVRSVQSRLGDERFVWRFCTALFAGCSILKGLRMPNAWAMTQAQLDYSQGFIKRGLMGAIYGSLGIRHAHTLAIYFFLELFALFVLWGILGFRSNLEERFGAAYPVAVFTGSFAVTFLTHLVGYTDVINIALGSLVLLVRAPRRRFVLALGVTTFGLLVHENFLLICLPVILFSFFLDALSDASTQRTALKQMVILIALAVAIVLSNSIKGNLSAGEILSLKTAVLQRVDFPVRNEVFDLLGLSLGENLRFGAHRLLTLRWYGALALGMCLLLPSLLCLLAFARRLVRERLPAKSPWAAWAWPAALAVVFLPEFLNLVGIDEMRWHVLCVVNAFLVLAALSRFLPQGDVSSSRADRYAVFIALGLSMAGGYSLYDHATINPYPFFPALLHH